MKNILAFTVIAFVTIGLTGCANTQSATGMSKQQIGTLVGGAAGAATGAAVFGGGARTYGIIGGALVGALLGSSIGHSMDKQDAQQALQASINTPLGKEAVWRNQKTGTTYVVRPVGEYVQGSAFCRKAQILIDGGKQKAYTTVCKGADGKWYVKS